ncbi:MAG TPA: NAD(P)-dependent oxidoreductase [Thermomicrobiales bacterium]
MRVFVAGGTGAIGRRLVPQLVEQGHAVVATTRSTAKARLLREFGAEPVVMDALDESAVVRAVAVAKPDVIIHQLTALSGFRNLKRFDQEFAETNRLRTEGLDYLLKAARASGVRRVIAQSYTGWPNIREGGPVKTEADPLDPNPPAAMAQSLRAIRYLERTLTQATDIEGIVLRYGSLYGPGTMMSLAGEHVMMIRQRRFPLIGDGAGVWSFIHVDDAARATVLAVERGAPGIYNIVDDEPAPVSMWLPYLAKTLGSKPPRRVPVWLARMMVGEPGVSMMTRIRGSSNQKARLALGWQPRFASWREGFRSGLSDDAAAGQAVDQLRAA